MRCSALLFVLFAAFATRGQMAPVGPQAMYEGQPVSAVDLIANPHRDLEPLGPLVSQKAGQPYSEANVQASIASLEKIGGFEKVTEPF
jgi:outer membrane protein assembly factor BamA